MGITLKSIAKRAGVSIPTASSILNGRGQDLGYKEATRRVVLEAAASLNYRPDSMAHRNGRKLTRRDAIGLLIRSESASHVANAPAYELICGVNDVLMEHEQFLVMTKLGQLEQKDEAKLPRLIAERFIDGLIVETGLPPHLEQAVTRYQIPTIWLNSDHHDEMDCVYPDEIHAARLVTERLIHLGHQRILYIAPPVPAADSGKMRHFSLLDRPRGYELAMAAAGLQPSISQNHLPDFKASLLKRIEKKEVTAIVAHSIGHVGWLRELFGEQGIRCPRDISVIAADDYYDIRKSRPEISGITLDRYQMGRWATEMMLEKVTTGRPQPSRVFKGELIAGGTVAPCQ